MQAQSPAWGLIEPPYLAPQTGRYGLTFTFHTLAFFIFFPGSWLWTKWKNVYSDHTVDVLVREEERFHSHRAKTQVDM